VDRWDRRRLMITVNLIQAASILPLLLVDQLGLWVIYAVLVTESSVSQLFGPARLALVPSLLSGGKEELLTANALTGVAGHLARLIGPAVGGVIVAITRKLDRNGNAFAIVKLEDFTGKIECIFWSDAFRTYQHLVVDEKPVFLRGKIRKGGPDEAPTVVVDEAFEIAGMRKKVTRGVLLRLYDGEESNKAIRDVQAICAKYKGNCNTFITIETAQGASRKYRLGETFKVEPSDELVRECDKIFGTNRLLFCR